MKITPEHYDRMKQEIFTMIKDKGLHPFMVQNNRTAWEACHVAGCTSWLHDAGYSDYHINTALNKIFREVRG